MVQSVDWVVRLLTQASVLIPLLMFLMATGLGAKTHIELHSSWRDWLRINPKSHHPLLAANLICITIFIHIHGGVAV